MDLRIVVIFGGAFALIWSITRWQRALQVVFYLVVVEGALRKWVFPGAQDLIYFGKDALLVGIYIGYMRAQGRYRPAKASLLYACLGLGAGIGLLEIFNPALPNILVGILGFKAYFFYVPLLFVLPAAFPTDLALARFLHRYVLFAIPVGLLGIAQFFSPAGSFLNTYARAAGPSESYVTTFGSSSFVRVTATFSYITGYASYLLAMAILTLAILGTTRWKFKGNVLVYTSFGLTFLGMLMAGSRGSILIFALVLPLYWWLVVLRERQGGATVMRILIALAGIGAIVNYAGADALGAFAGRAAGTGGELFGRMLGPLTDPFDLLYAAGSLGYGIGSTHQTAEAVTQGIAPYSWLHGLLIETESGKVMVELGPFGFLVIYFLRIYLALFALLQVFRLRTSFHRTLATTTFLFFLAQIFGSVIFDVTADLFYWLFGGLLTTAMVLDRSAVRATAQPSTLASPKRPVRTLPMSAPTTPWNRPTPGEATS
jgi:hypothetical protein